MFEDIIKNNNELKEAVSITSLIVILTMGLMNTMMNLVIIREINNV